MLKETLGALDDFPPSGELKLSTGVDTLSSATGSSDTCTEHCELFNLLPFRLTLLPDLIDGCLLMPPLRSLRESDIVTVWSSPEAYLLAPLRFMCALMRSNTSAACMSKACCDACVGRRIDMSLKNARMWSGMEVPNTRASSGKSSGSASMMFGGGKAKPGVLTEIAAGCGQHSWASISSQTTARKDVELMHPAPKMTTTAVALCASLRA
mmetsp:Transcript_24357/g.56597  ORF Transcript_24357/g.56597 Transcript_24357/m.56597 type:complete len:210 (+) Transcript_24357:179-808(+)